MKHSERWKTLERDTAAALGGRRIVRQDLFESAPDVIVTDTGLLAECKAYRRFRHHRLLETARRKYGHLARTVILVTKEERQVGSYVTMPLDYFADLLNQLRTTTAGTSRRTECSQWRKHPNRNQHRP